MKEVDCQHDKDALYFLCWIDSVERLDTLILESRHLQQNIIYMLHMPELYLPLKDEEAFLWDEGLKDEENFRWEKLIGYSVKEIQDNARACIKDYPSLEAVTEMESAEDGNLVHTLKQIHLSGKWNSDQRAHYLSLAAVQSIKRDIFVSKLFLCRQAFRTFARNNSSGKGKDQLSKEFLILRAGIQAQMKTYIARLGDHLSLFSHSQDFGLHDHPRPNTVRRREQHMYGAHLRDSCRDMYNELSLMLGSLSDPPPVKEEKANTFHRWMHDFSSHSYSIHGPKEKNYFHYINTSYWMPERPDLQSVIAHEVAHGVIIELFEDLSHQKLDQLTDGFSRLLKELDQCIQIFDVNKCMDSSIHLKEIAADLLATTVRGSAYLYALFLELIGSGLEDIFIVTGNPSKIELQVIEDIENSLGVYSQIRDWYIRLYIASTWLDEILPKKIPSHDLSCRLSNATQQILDDLSDYLEQNTNPVDNHEEFWRSLKNRLCKIIKYSTVTEEIKDWLRKKHTDHYKRKGLPARYIKGSREFPRSTRTIHWRVRNHLVKSFVEKKRDLLGCINNRGKTDKNFGGEEKLFKTIYRVDFDGVIATRSNTSQETRAELICPNMFTTIHDIPWQCSFLRGLDFSHPNSPFKFERTDSSQKTTDFLWQIHNHTAMGRELYQAALEFHVRDIESAWNRLADAVRVIEYYLTNADNAQLRAWLGNACDLSEHKIQISKIHERLQNLKTFVLVSDEDINTEVISLNKLVFGNHSACSLR